jgi:hypothetical protein
MAKIIIVLLISLLPTFIMAQQNKKNCFNTDSWGNNQFGIGTGMGTGIIYIPSKESLVTKLTV